MVCYTIYTISHIDKDVKEVAEKITFIHAADLHLDSPFLGLADSPKQVYQAAEESTFFALNNLVQTAIDKRVDFILLVGDIFDATLQSLKAQLKLRDAFETLQKHHIYVYMSYGNHDYMNNHTYEVSYPNNVFIFPRERVTFFNYPNDNLPKATIYGFSYGTRHVKERKVEQFERENNEAPFHIAMLHGSLSGMGGHETYAPFTLSDVTNKPFDYWALGHIHQRQVVHELPPVVYPGNIQGRHHLESGTKGCYYVELSKAGCELTFVPLNVIQFASIELEVNDCDTVFALEQRLDQYIEKNVDRTLPHLIKLHLIGDEQLYTWERYDYLSEMIEVMNERYLLNNNWIYIYDVTTAIKQTIERTVAEEHFYQTLQKEFTQIEVAPFLTSLYEHPQARKFLHPLTEEEEEQIKQKAKQLLVEELFQTKR